MREKRDKCEKSNDNNNDDENNDDDKMKKGRKTLCQTASSLTMPGLGRKTMDQRSVNMIQNVESII